MKNQSVLYVHHESVHNMTAPAEAVPVIMNMLKPRSVLDVGCGTGTWLKAFSENGVQDIVGIDGAYVERSHLKIPQNQFIAKDLRATCSLNRKFDLVISLEVAEHLPEENADVFIETLVRHADTLIFSAAIPNQGGQNHLNEQWPAYWEKKFAVHGFYLHDVIRPLIWNNPRIDWWYRQNMFLVTREKSSPVMNFIHPECFEQRIRVDSANHESILSGKLGFVGSLKILAKSIKNIF